MNGIQGTKAQNIEKFPGCLGRMVNLFDLTTGVPGNRLLNDKPHYHGSSLSRSHSDVVRMLSPSFVDPIEDKLVVSEVKRTSSDEKTNGTPMKTLLAQEMSKEVESKHNPPNVVAKLMGLETLPRHQPNLAAQRSHPRGFQRRSLSQSEMPTKCWEQDEGYLEKQMQHDAHHRQELNKCKDVYEIWQRSEKTKNYASVHSPQEKYIDVGNERKMDLVRQKFMEVKHLSTDEKLRQSKEFQDALEVLSVNKELFLQFLQEPNSMFSQHLYNLQSLPPPPETKRITVLRPSNIVENDKLRPTGKKVDKQIRKPAQVGKVTGWDRSNPGCPPFDSQNVNEHPAQPTRIVVLRPSPGKSQGAKAAPLPSSPCVFSGVEDFFEEPEDDAEESREVVQVITRQMRENMIGHRRDETMLSSVFSNGYIGDDSSFNKSEYAAGNFSDSEVTSPASRHSWDYTNRFASPNSSSSFCRASCSPESSVCREAKKRLSERWAMMASNGKSEELRHVRRSSSTLGEMLALSDTKKPATSDKESKEQQPRGSTSCIMNNEESTNGSPKNLLRSKSVPVSSTAFGAILNVEVWNLEGGKMQSPKEATKAKSMKSSLKGKVSSLFFSKNKKKGKSNASSQSKDDSSSATPGTPGCPVVHLQNSDRTSQCINDGSFEECPSPGLGRSSTPDSTCMEKDGMISREASLSIANPFMPAHVIENQDQPSPVSVLEPPFEEDEATKLESSHNVKLEHGGARLLPKSNLIDKSPPIESIARTLSWDDSCAETGTTYKPSGSPGLTEEEENWPCFVQSLLSSAGFDHEARLDSFSARCHSPQSPLDPSLRDKYANLNEPEPVHESKRRQRRSNRKLAFDCVNAALVDITSYGFDKGAIPSPTLVDYMWAQMKDWFSSDVMGTTTGDDGDNNNSLVVEKVIRKEVVGNGWADQTKLEIDNLGKEIERKMLEELVEDAVMDLTGRAIS